MLSALYGVAVFAEQHWVACTVMFATWIVSLLVKPMKRCGRCDGRGYRPGTAGPCRRCRGRRERWRAGASLVTRAKRATRAYIRVYVASIRERRDAE